MNPGMTDEVTPEEVKASTDAEMFPDDQPTAQETLNYSRLISEGAIPIPPAIAELFENRFRSSLRLVDKYHKDWKASIEQFRGDPIAQESDTRQSEEAPEENLVRTTVETLVDFTYMRNPDVEITGLNERSKPMEAILTEAVKALVNKRARPGLNLRPKIIKTVVYSHLSNFGVLKLDFQTQKGSVEEAQQVFAAAQEKIKAAKDEDELSTYYAALDTIHKEMIARAPFGVAVKSVSPFSIFVDPECQNSDLSDAAWLMEQEMLPIGHIRSEYMTYDEDERQYRFRYDPNVVFEENAKEPPTTQVLAESILNELMPEMDEDQKKTISENALPCIRVYDRVTNLVYLYIKDRWDTPLWVYENEMNLSRFYPFFILPFSTPLASVYQRSEVSHYLPFQREINRINRQMANVRRIAFSLFLYDSASIDSKEVDKLLKEATSGKRAMRALGVKLKDKDKSLSEALEPFRLPSTQFKEIFDKSDLQASVQNASRINEALKGAEFRTNTTNDAIATYNNFAQTRLEGLTDKVEQLVEELFWAICELIVSKFDKETITSLVTEEKAEQFTPMTVEEFNDAFTLTIAAGSSEKPTSQNKKQEAVQIIQMLGQFGSAMPMTVLRIVTTLLRSAFSRTLVTDKDLEDMREEGEAFMQKGISQSQEGGQQQPPQQQ